VCLFGHIHVTLLPKLAVDLAVGAGREESQHEALVGHHVAAELAPVGVLAHERAVHLHQLVDHGVVDVAATAESSAVASSTT